MIEATVLLIGILAVGFTAGYIIRDIENRQI